MKLPKIMNQKSENGFNVSKVKAKQLFIIFLDSKKIILSISKRITSLIFLNIYIPPQHGLAHIILFALKKIDKAKSKFDLKIKKSLHINWRKPNLNAQQNHLALTLLL